MGLLIAIAGVVTPLGLYQALIPADDVQTPFQYLKGMYFSGQLFHTLSDYGHVHDFYSRSLLCGGLLWSSELVNPLSSYFSHLLSNY